MTKGHQTPDGNWYFLLRSSLYFLDSLGGRATFLVQGERTGRTHLHEPGRTTVGTREQGWAPGCVEGGV